MNNLISFIINVNSIIESIKEIIPSYYFSTHLFLTEKLCFDLDFVIYKNFEYSKFNHWRIFFKGNCLYHIKKMLVHAINAHFRMFLKSLYNF